MDLQQSRMSCATLFCICFLHSFLTSVCCIHLLHSFPAFISCIQFMHSITAISLTLTHSILETEPDTPEKQRDRAVEAACDIIDISGGVDGFDNKAAGNNTWGAYGTVRMYLTAGVIYANATEAHILKPNLQPSTYYGRRPLAGYITKGRKLGIAVVRGFDQAAWDKLYPPMKSAKMTKAMEGVSTSQSGAPPDRRQKSDAELAQSERAKVTDLILVIHGIGQKLSERMESFHFTHAINAFRREVSVELGTDAVKVQLRKDAGGIMVLPVSEIAIVSGSRLET